MRFIIRLAVTVIIVAVAADATTVVAVITISIIDFDWVDRDCCCIAALPVLSRYSMHLRCGADPQSVITQGNNLSPGCVVR